MFRDLLSSRVIQAGVIFCVVIVGCSLLYSWHVRRTTEAELEQQERFLQQRENKKEPHTPQNTVTIDTEGLDPQEAPFAIEDLSESNPTPSEGTEEPLLEEPEPASAVTPAPEDVLTKTDFPEVPESFPITPVWEKIPNYQKGDMQTHETLYRVLIKLWNQGDHGFVNGVLDHNNGRVYPLYPDVIYVKWKESVMGPPDNPVTIRIPGSMLGTHERHFTWEDRFFGLEEAYPEIRFVEKHTAGHDPETFLADDEK